jgi:hypothetical protein
MNAHLHTPVALWPVWRQPAEQALRAMLSELEGLAITGGESSVRMSPKGVVGGRWLAGFSPVGVSVTRLMGLPERLGMPGEDAVQFRTHLPRARQIYLAVEQSDVQVVAKVYLEYALPAPDLSHRAPEHRQVALSIEACKWRVDAPVDSVRRTEYWRMSGLDGGATVALLNEAQGLSPVAQPLYAAVGQVLDKALHAAPDWRGYRLLVLREPGLASQGVCVRFYGSDLRALDAMQPLATFFDAWGIAPERQSDLKSVWANQELGWLHAGLDAQTQPYLTIYGALNSAETRAVLMQRGAARLEPRATLQES